MKVIAGCCIAIVIVCCLPRIKTVDQTNTYDEPYRPQYHFTPRRNWMNDPNGPIFYRGEYHLFFQYNPYGDQWGHMSWGHAVSTDLVHWRQRPVALAEQDGVMIFSGSTVVDWLNTSGFCNGAGQSCLVAIYTGAAADRQTQNVAYSNDRGRTWTKYSGNPVLDLHLRDFRDPKVFWYKATHRWIMAVSLAAQHKISFFSSPDLKHWAALSDFGPAGAVDGVWECPDLFKLPIEGEPGQTRWVLSVNLNPGGIAGGSGNQYFIGRFDGSKFISETGPHQALWADYGKDFYASTSFAEIPGNRRIWIGWLDNWEYASRTPTHPWRGTQSIPRVLTLRRSPGGLRLVQRPVEELRRLRAMHLTVAASDIAAANQELKNKQASGDALEISAEMDAGSASTVGIKVLAGDHEETAIGADLESHTVFVDRTHSGDASFSAGFPGRQSGPLERTDGKHVLLHVFVDRSSVEVFANRGETVISDLVFPSRGSRAIKMYSVGGKTRRVKLDVWRLKSAGGPPFRR